MFRSVDKYQYYTDGIEVVNTGVDCRRSRPSFLLFFLRKDVLGLTQVTGEGLVSDFPFISTQYVRDRGPV